MAVRNLSTADGADPRPSDQEMLDHPANIRQGQPSSFFIAQGFKQKETIGYYLHGPVVMPAKITSTFVMVEAQIIFLLLIVLLYSPPDLGKTDHSP